jgi:poly[(R)-3-hydroxyalkanoate] polymerase subunit PhaC
VERNALRARNGIRMAAGLSRPKLGTTPKDVVWRRGRSELWHYRNDNVRFSPPLLIVFSLFSRSNILDLQPGNSFVERLLSAGLDVYLLDWGVPDERDAANQLEDYVDDYIPAAVERVRHLAGAEEINLLGYCFGSVLSLLYAAHHLDAPLRSLTVMTTPVDLQQLGPLISVIGKDGLDVETMLDTDGNLPPQIIHQAFQVLKPTAQITQYVDLWERLWGDDYVTAHQAMAGWASDHIPLPGGVAKQLANLVQDNAIVNDTLVLGGDRVTLSAITVPFLTVLATRDHIVPEASAAPLINLIGSPDKHELRLDAGHVGLLVGRTAAKTTIPTIIEFLIERSEAPQ